MTHCHKSQVCVSKPTLLFRNTNQDMKTQSRTCFLRRGIVLIGNPNECLKTQNNVSKHKSRYEDTYIGAPAFSAAALSMQHKRVFQNANQDNDKKNNQDNNSQYEVIKLKTVIRQNKCERVVNNNILSHYHFHA